MQPRSRYALAIVAVAMVATACSGSSDQPALCNVPGDLAVVNGSSVTCDDMYRLRPEYGEVEVIAPGEQVRTDLTTLIRHRAMLDGAEAEFGLQVTEGDTAARIANPPARWQGLLADPAVSESERQINAQTTLVSDAVVPQLIVAEYGDIGTFAAQRPEAVVQVCVRTIVVPTEEEAFEVLNRIDAGETFEDVEPEVSLAAEQFPGGLLTIGGTCPISVGQLGEQFVLATALSPLGEPTGPVPDSGGFFHVLIVDERIVPESDATAADLLDLLDPNVQSLLFNEWLGEVLDDMEVEVASAIGTWSPAGFGIAPPGFPTQGG